MSGSLGRTAIGWIAAAISVLVVHESVAYVLKMVELTQRQPWSMNPPVPPFGVPYLLNLVFWGGLWGILFAHINQWLPGRAMWLKGLIYGLLIVSVSGWIIVPFIKGQIFGVPNQPFFSGFDPKRMLPSVLIVGSFGLGLGAIYGLITSRSR